MQASQKITLLFRGAAFLMDIMIYSAIMQVIVWIFYKIPVFEITPVIIGIAFILMFFRDVFGKSIGKYLLGLNIIDSRSKDKSKVYQRLLKNITLPLWFVEAPIVIFSKKHRRIGDLLAKTETTVDENKDAFKLASSIFQ